MSDEEEVLLLPGMPLVNRTGENKGNGLWTFDVETPVASVNGASSDIPRPLIDYVHPGDWMMIYSHELMCWPKLLLLSTRVGRAWCATSAGIKCAYLVVIYYGNYGFEPTENTNNVNFCGGNVCMLTSHSSFVDWETLFQDASWRRFSSAWFIFQSYYGILFPENLGILCTWHVCEKL